jgi:Amino acid transporters
MRSQRSTISELLVVTHASTNPLGLDFGGNWITGAALIAVLAHVYIFYGFESAGDIAEETKDAGRQVPRAMRLSLIWGGIASFILVASLLLAMPEGPNAVAQTIKGDGVPFILSELPSWLQDGLLLLIIFAFFSCGSSVQGAGSRLAFSYARDGAVPGAGWIARVNQRFKTPVNALLVGAGVTILFVLLVFPSPDHDVKLGFITYPANVNGLVSLVSFGVSGIYLSFLMTVIGSMVARSRGWIGHRGGSVTRHLATSPCTRQQMRRRSRREKYGYESASARGQPAPSRVPGCVVTPDLSTRGLLWDQGTKVPCMRREATPTFVTR